LSGAGLLFGIDHSFGTAASTSNVIGNSIAVRVLTERERTFDQQKLDAYVNRRYALPNLRPICD
jgi:aerobic C4-dicarboxylate transport protein